MIKNIVLVKKKLEDRNIRERILELETKIEKYNRAYYDENRSLISDYKYDLLKKELEFLRSKYGVNKIRANIDMCTDANDDRKVAMSLFGAVNIEQKVGYKPNSKFKKVIHKQQMMSLANALTRDEFNEFVDKTKRFLNINYFPDSVCELKIDGLSFSAMYSKGKLQYVATRGDGLVGEDVTINVLQIDMFPKELPINSLASKLDIFEVRGEIYMPKASFTKLNDELDEKDRFSNPRNAASGTLRQLNSEIVKQRNLSYYAYAIGVCSEEITSSQYDTLIFLKKLGFIVNDKYRLVKTVDEILKYHKEIEEARYELDCDIDGIVVKINSFNLQKQLGNTAHDPRWAIAYKFSGITALTKIEGVVNQVGRTGIITPVAELVPVNIGGVVVKRATLHNYDEIKRLNLAIGDLVVVKRAGDVIPKIIEVKEKNKINRVQISEPLLCPCCCSRLTRHDNEVAIICENHAGCKDQIIDSIRHFASRKGLDISGLGTRNIIRFYDLNILKNILDVFNLKQYSHILVNLDGFGFKSTQNLLSAIEASKNVAFDKVLYAIGIDGVGESVAKIIARYYENFDTLLNDKNKFSKLIGINGLGDVVIDSLKEYFNDKDNLIFIESLKNILHIMPFITNNSKAKPELIGKSIIFTGKLISMTRNQAKLMAEQLGFKVLSSISGKVDYLVYGSNVGSKLEKAKELGVKAITEDEWKLMIE